MFELRGNAVNSMHSSRDQIVSLCHDYTIETTPGSAAKIDHFGEHLATGCTVAVTFLPGSDYRDTVSTAARLRKEGFEPAPHIAARSVRSRLELEDFVARLSGDAGVTHIVALAGGVARPTGPYESSMDILGTGILDRHGIRKIGIAGHPEGSPDIADKLLKHALKWKNDFAARTGANMYIATQFVFEAEPVIAWDRMIQSEGSILPVHIGVPGLATLKTLLNHAKACGIGPSMRFLTRQARNVTRLMSVSSPDKLVIELARYKATDPRCGISHVHVYPLGGMRRSAAWFNELANGKFAVDEVKNRIKLDNPVD